MLAKNQATCVHTYSQPDFLPRSLSLSLSLTPKPIDRRKLFRPVAVAHFGGVLNYLLFLLLSFLSMSKSSPSFTSKAAKRGENDTAKGFECVQDSIDLGQVMCITKSRVGSSPKDPTQRILPSPRLTPLACLNVSRLSISHLSHPAHIPPTMTI